VVALCGCGGGWGWQGYGLRSGASLEGEQAFKLHAVADIAVGKLAFMDDAASALNEGTRTTGEISGHVSAATAGG
jgi:hypothetical protein